VVGGVGGGGGSYRLVPSGCWPLARGSGELEVRCHPLPHATSSGATCCAAPELANSPLTHSPQKSILKCQITWEETHHGSARRGRAGNGQVGAFLHYLGQVHALLSLWHPKPPPIDK